MAERPIDTGGAESLSLGWSPNPTDAPFHGIMDDVRIYDAALSPTHITSLYREATAQQ
jgi:hypothetical protein